MKICLVSAFPPSGRMLNEYGFHIARELQRDPLLSVTVLADRLAEEAPELPDFDVRRVWDFNSLRNPSSLLRAIRDINPDVVWYNLLFTTFGNAHNPLAAFLGTSMPALTRMRGYYTHVTLHHLIEHVDMKDGGIRHARLYRAAGTFATRVLLMANSISVLLPAYRRTLLEKYRGENIHFRAHGILSGRPEFPDFSRRGNPEHRILALGHWGTYKRLELLMEAWQQVRAAVPQSRLVIGGADHPMTPGYMDSIKAQHSHDSRIDFVGYVPEEKIPEVFGGSTVLVMPYSSATGASGVAHQACEYGVPILSADIKDFREMANDEGMAIDFYRLSDSTDLAGKLTALLQSPERQREMAEQNFSAALRQTMPQIIQQYLRAFTLHQKSKVLEPISRFRRIPSWIPKRSTIFRAALTKGVPWT
jgi:glycosyltransferase involved in cell wall biosynthesis